MSMIINCLVVGLGGAIGAVSRYLLGLMPVKNPSGFPIITLFINVVGAFCIGIIVGLAGKNNNFNQYLLLFIKVGICGGFTTFSTFSLESLGLIQRGQYFTAITYMVLSVLLCILAVFGAEILVK